MRTINPSERHRPMGMSVRSGSPAMCMAVALPELRECVLVSSGVNPTLAVPTLVVSPRRTVMMSEALTD